jgi:hypothetical protein
MKDILKGAGAAFGIFAFGFIVAPPTIWALGFWWRWWLP